MGSPSRSQRSLQFGVSICFTQERARQTFRAPNILPGPCARVMFRAHLPLKRGRPMRIRLARRA